MDFTPHTESEIAGMLKEIGVSRIDDLFECIPAECRVAGGLSLPAGMTEAEVVDLLQGMAGRNDPPSASFLGAGANDHYVPAAIKHLIGRGEFLTSYTPYQPEVSQGTLQAQFEYQTMVASLLGMDVSNASMYEGATAVAEACNVACRNVRRNVVVVSRAVHPQYREVLATYLGADRLREVGFDPATGATDTAALAAALQGDVGAVVVQSPNFFGVIEDVQRAADLAHGAQALLVATFTEALAFGLIEAPGNLGADIAAGEGQSLGLPLSFGGPYIGLFAVKAPFVKGMPGRLVGRTRDSQGSDCYVLTLAAREQHIRRERAGSNICSNEGLCAVSVAIYLSLLGTTGFARLAAYNHARTESVKSRLAARPGLALPFAGATFNEFVVRLPGPADEAVARCDTAGLVPGLALGTHYPELADCLLVSVTERRTDAQIDTLVSTL